MRTPSVRRSITLSAVAAALALVASAAPAQASIITFDFTGEYTNATQTIFGQSGSPLPFHYSLTYDTALGQQTDSFTFGPSSVYGYSAAGITSLSMTFGTQTWTLNDLQARTPVKRLRWRH